MRSLFISEPDWDRFPQRPVSANDEIPDVVRRNRPSRVLGEMALVLTLVGGIAYGVTSVLPALGIHNGIAAHAVPVAGHVLARAHA